MAKARVTRSDFLEDRQGKTFVDVVNDPQQPFDHALEFFNDADRHAAWRNRKSTTIGPLWLAWYGNLSGTLRLIGSSQVFSRGVTHDSGRLWACWYV